VPDDTGPAVATLDSLYGPSNSAIDGMELVMRMVSVLTALEVRPSDLVTG
jgi:hypothetical protein